MKRNIWLLFFLLALQRSGAQVFGGTPPFVKWQYIQAIPANIIFPPGLDSQAREVMFLVSALSKTTLPTIGPVQKPIDIIFHNLTVISNGYVQLAPFRSEFQLTPTQNSFELGSLPWNQTLAIHEYRHVQQYNNFNVGLAKAFYILFGQDGLAFANSLAVPNWFFEGDAVYQETLVSQQGRGRLPLFLTGFEALWVSRKNYSWMKIRNGSYRDFIPDHYPLGYMLVAYGRDRYGAEFWEKTAREAAAFRGFFYPLQKAIQHNTGVPFDTYRQRATDYFKQQVPQKAFSSQAADFGKKSSHFVSDQLFPQFIDNQQIVMLNSSYRLPPEFVIQKTKGDKNTRIRYRAFSLDDAFSYRNHRIAYTAYEPDLRWGWQDYSVIRVLDVDTKKDLRLTDKTKYFSPDISPDDSMLLAVNMPASGFCSLDLIDIHSGKLLLRLPNPGHLIYTYPKFLNAGEIVTAVRNPRGEMAVLRVQVRTGEADMLVNWSMDPVGFLSVDDGKIYFTRTYKGCDQGYCYSNGAVFSLNADASAGNYQLSGYKGNLVWNSFSSAGYRVQWAGTDSVFDKTPIVFPIVDTFENHLVYSLNNPPFQIPYPIKDSLFTSKTYSKGTHLFNFHSWRPYFNDPDYTLSLLGENVLSTFQSELYVGYNSNEKYKKAGMDFSYGALFPFLTIGTEYRIDRNAYNHSQKIYWNELLPYAGFFVPLNLSRGRWFTSLEAGSNISFHKQYFQRTFQDSIKNSAYFSLDPQLVFTHQMQVARMQIYPSFAQSLLLLYNRAVTDISGNQFLASANFYFPGLTSTHSLVFRAAFQQHDSSDQVHFSNSFPFSRGYSGENFYRMAGFGINYNFPLLYPDWGFANLIYFLRIRANAFYDYTGVPSFATNGSGVQAQYRSTGIEIYLDTKWWNQLALSFGIRYSRLLDADYEGRGPNQWELILPLNILNNGFSSHLPVP